ncbi:uncharacterized protein PHALS_06212 [Plasmopara halstedii]|uniref:Uncharacterized protein n=1 Tax=Plasmopara halstedii TaxID=4781 RepID=A0A0N7L7Y7_PLAHL|nr:uncharacterized protein PHALS_06212 [Plasmopara halstedii]CEG48387.1 hypothetical protein PHALS_06212 [Plasmopara halstedii]|eukprot:XP_024584756.1 hypothetical protein PHALS_06212 [Plasmopara halstedii]
MNRRSTKTDAARAVDVMKTLFEALGPDTTSTPYMGKVFPFPLPRQLLRG